MGKLIKGGFAREAGAIAVLNILMMADLAKHFSAVWTLSARVGQPDGVYRTGHEWRTLLRALQQALCLLDSVQNQDVPALRMSLFIAVSTTCITTEISALLCKLVWLMVSKIQKPFSVMAGSVVVMPEFRCNHSKTQS